MGGTDTSRKSFWLNPAGNLVEGITGSSTLGKLTNPLATDPLTFMAYDKAMDKAGTYLDRDQVAAEKEAARQDELLKKLALGENPYLTTDEKTETLGV